MDDHTARATSFGQVADAYHEFRPGPPAGAVDWLLPAVADTAVDLGAGTGALSRLLLARVPTVIAVEPDPAMRDRLGAIEGLDVREGRGEHLPVPDASVDAVVASSSWH